MIVCTLVYPDIVFYLDTGARNSVTPQLVLLDRDGVINVDSPDYIKSPEEWHPISGAMQAIVQLQRHVTVAVCTNQSGVGRGLFDEDTLAAIHQKLNDALIASGGRPLDVFYCPHHPDDGCPCRKPQPGLLECAMQAYGIAPDATVYAGDSAKDLQAAANAGCHSALILTGNGNATATTRAASLAAWTCDSLSDLPAALDAPN